jgi:cell division protein FtsB
MPGNAVTSSAPPTSPTGTGSHESAESTTRTRQIPSELERASQSSKKNEAELAAQAELLKSQTEAIKELARRVSELEQRLNKLSPKGKKP